MSSQSLIDEGMESLLEELIAKGDPGIHGAYDAFTHKNDPDIHVFARRCKLICRFAY